MTDYPKDAASAPAGVGVPNGMKPWAGYEAYALLKPFQFGPEDWDGGPVLYRNGNTGIPHRYWEWDGRQGQADIIAYTALARPRAAVGEVPCWSRRMTEEEARELVGFEPETILTCLREWGYVEDAALQSPPAKVEG